MEIPPHLQEAYAKGLERRAADPEANNATAPVDEDDYGENDTIEWEDILQE